MSAQHVNPSHVAQAPPRRRARPDEITRREGLLLCEHFLSELLSHRLDVYVKSDPDRGVCGTRGLADQNPEWYRRFCSLYERDRGRLTARCDWCEGWHRRGGKCLSKKRTRVYALHLHRGESNHFAIIKRRHTVAGLERILAGGTETVYTERLREFIRRHGREYLREVL